MASGIGRSLCLPSGSPGHIGRGHGSLVSASERVHSSRRGQPMKKPRTAVRQNRSVRCAIYTRKSSEEGLEQEFNSLQAQREACEAFINSQRHEGWVGLRAAYDDGGFSGATMDRPALKQLLEDITAGRVDTVVVYKIDRLTRALADFAKIVEILDARGASFVSVTQQFNTTTSMGVRRDKAALSSGCEAHPAIRSSRKQPEQAWRRRNV